MMPVRYRFLVLAIPPLLFFGCTDPNALSDSCVLDSQIKIVSVLPGGRVDMSKPSVFQNPSEPQVMESYGVYVKKNSVLTVAHAVPENARVSGFSSIRSDPKKELLLLSAQQCGRPLFVFRSPLTIGTDLFDCDSQKPMGTVSDVNITSFSQLPFSSSTKPLEGLAFLPGDFSPGDSGRGFCNRAGELATLLVATDESGNGLLIPSEELVEFLN